MRFAHRGRLTPRALPPPHPPAPGPYAVLPLTQQFGGAGGSSDRSDWVDCHDCGKPVPAYADTSGWVGASGEVRRDPTGLALRPTPTGTVSYVCPHCLATQVGCEVDNHDFTVQEHCHACKGALAGQWLCPSCGMPRGWAPVGCPSCGRFQAVCAPHLAQMCDVFSLDCVGCGFHFDSFCIC